LKFTNEIKVGLLTLVSLVVLIIGFNYLRGADIFSHSYYYYSVYDKVDGLAVSKPILVNGFQIGRVADMKLRDDGQILVKFEVSRDYVVPRQTNARLENTDLLGNKAIVFHLGSSNEHLNNGDTIASSNVKSLSEAVAPLQVKTEKLLTRIDSLLGTLNSVVNPRFQKNIDRSMNSVANTLGSLESFAKNVNNQAPRLEMILRDVESMTGNLKDNNKNISAIIANFKIISDKTAKADFSRTLDEVNKTMAQLNSAVAKINNGQGSLGQLINDRQLYTNLTNSTASLNRLMVDLKQNPKRYVSFSLFGGGGSSKKKADSTRR